MAVSIAAAVTKIKNHLNEHVTPDDILNACLEAGHEWRERKLGPVVTVWALLMQILHNNPMTGVSRLVGAPFSAAAYCQAIQRLPLEVLRTLLRRFVARQRDATAEVVRQRDATDEVARWRGLRIFFVDGSSCSMPGTPPLQRLQRRFEQPTEQKSGCGFTTAHLLALFDAYTGMLVDVLASSWRIYDLKRVGELHPHLGADDLLVADRGFCSYAHLALLQQRGVQALIRLHGQRRVSFKPGRIRWAGCAWPHRLGKNDQIMIWRKSSVPSRVLPREENDALPETLIVRELRYRVVQPGYRTRQVALATTLLDAQAYPAGELADLYCRRWRAEINLRHLKETLGMRVLRSKSQAGVERELLAFALVYNVICSVMTVIALHLEIAPERISLIDAVRLLRRGLDDLATAAVVVNPDRPGRHQPRVVKRRPLQYSRMTKPRAVLKKELMKNNERIT